jgi:riboflavin synthase
MFTGLVEEVGELAWIDGGPDGARLGVRTSVVQEGLAIGDSVAVNGACLTAVTVSREGFAVDCVAETLRRTSLGARRQGDGLNLERALRADARVGGHFVQGHVDGVVSCRGVRPDGEGIRLELGCEPHLMRYVVEKGSVALDGVSLTVAALTDDGFEVALIPHTIAETTLGPDLEGASLNLEVDVLAKYVEALVAPHLPQ